MKITLSMLLSILFWISTPTISFANSTISTEQTTDNKKNKKTLKREKEEKKKREKEEKKKERQERKEEKRLEKERKKREKETKRRKELGIIDPIDIESGTDTIPQQQVIRDEPKIEEKVVEIEVDTTPIIDLPKSELVGRWKVVKEGKTKETATKPKYPNHYMFRANGIFFLGLSNEGVILFNQSGKFLIENKIIDATYYDFLQGKHPKRKRFIFKPIAKDADSFEAKVINEKDESYYIHLEKVRFD